MCNNSELTPGTILTGNTSSYRIVRTLGQGSFGITYLAESVAAAGNVACYVAIKEFFMQDVNMRRGNAVATVTASGNFEYFRHKFETEAMHVKSLSHPNIVHSSDTFHANGTVYFVMEYIDGESLASRIGRAGRLSEREALSVARQIASALSLMHHKGMIHLDVKPDNIMMRGDEAVLVDFGLSKQYDASGRAMTATLIQSGTNGYAPMEQFSYNVHDGLPATLDIHALGATMFKMLTGFADMRQLPFIIDEDGFPRGMLASQGVSAHTIDVIEKATAHLARDRFQTVDDMLAALCPTPRAAAGGGMLPLTGGDTTITARFQERETDYTLEIGLDDGMSDVRCVGHRPHPNLLTHFKVELFGGKDPDHKVSTGYADTDKLLCSLRGAEFADRRLWQQDNHEAYYEGNYGLRLDYTYGKGTPSVRFEHWIMRPGAAQEWVEALLRHDDIKAVADDVREWLKAHE